MSEKREINGGKFAICIRTLVYMSKLYTSCMKRKQLPTSFQSLYFFFFKRYLRMAKPNLFNLIIYNYVNQKGNDVLYFGNSSCPRSQPHRYKYSYLLLHRYNLPRFRKDQNHSRRYLKKRNKRRKISVKRNRRMAKPNLCNLIIYKDVIQKGNDISYLGNSSCPRSQPYRYNYSHLLQQYKLHRFCKVQVHSS